MFSMIFVSAVCIYALTLLYMFAPINADNVHGDKTIGGLHFFEVHSASGGTGIGVKIFIFLLILGLIIFCYYKWRNFRKRLSIISGTNIATNTAAMAVNALNPRQTFSPMDLQQAYPMSIMPRPCRHDDYRYPYACRGHRDHRRDRTPDSEDARLP